jgi:hypothetical protein
MHSMTRARRRLGDAALIAGLAAAWVAAGAPAAFAAHHPVATGTQYGGYTSQDDPLTITLAADRRHVQRLGLQVSAKCDDGKSLNYAEPARFEPDLPPAFTEGDNVLAGGALSPTGKLHAAGAGVEDYGTMVGALKETLTAKVRRGRATGTYAATFTLVDRQSGETATTCRTGTLKWLAVSDPGRVFAGQTTQSMPVVLELTPTGDTVDALRIGWYAACNEGGFSVGDHLRGFAVSKSGVFGTTFDNDNPLSDGSHQKFHWNVAGRIGAHKASGSIQVHEDDTGPDGAPTDSCDTGSVRWTATSSRKAQGKR